MQEALELFTTYFWLPATILFGWQYAELRVLRERIETKADKEDLDELKILLQELNKLVTEVRVDFARWRGQIGKQQQES